MLLETLVKYSSLFFHKIDKTDIRLFLESSPQYPNLLSVVQTLRYLDTDVFGVEISDLVASEALTTDYLHVFASPKFEWAYKKLELTLNLPVNLYSYFFSGTIHNRTEFFLSPSLAARFRIAPGMSLTLRGSARRSPASLHNIHDSSILTDYRSFTSGIDDYYTSSG